MIQLEQQLINLMEDTKVHPAKVLPVIFKPGDAFEDTAFKPGFVIFKF
jgi:hypothetical protein